MPAKRGICRQQIRTYVRKTSSCFPLDEGGLSPALVTPISEIHLLRRAAAAATATAPAGAGAAAGATTTRAGAGGAGAAAWSARSTGSAGAVGRRHHGGAAGVDNDSRTAAAVPESGRAYARRRPRRSAGRRRANRGRSANRLDATRRCRRRGSAHRLRCRGSVDRTGRGAVRLGSLSRSKGATNLGLAVGRGGALVSRLRGLTPSRLVLLLRDVTEVAGRRIVRRAAAAAR